MLDRQNKILDQLGSFIEDPRFKLFLEYLDLEIADRQKLILNSSNWDNFNEQKGLINGLSHTKEIVRKRMDAKLEREKQKREDKLSSPKNRDLEE